MAPHEINPLFFNRYRDNRGASDLAPFFDQQQPLWDRLEASGTNPLEKHGVNVLTMRLLLAQDALGRLKDYELDLRRKPGHYVVVSGAQLAASGVSNRTLSPDPEFGYSGEVFTPESIRAHEYFYSFVSSLVSALDRLANEINMLYALGITNADWNKLIQKKTLLTTHSSPLENILASADLDSRKTQLFDYRNVSEHEGVVRIDDVQVIDDKVTIDDNYVIMVSDNPRDPVSPAHTPLIQCAKDLFAFAIETCDLAYGAML